jgi:hypothetical protein|tara:strand:- start:264 stop:938 length:675 start_codon:yes stop_codon:yes gene_type:complete
MNGIQNLLTRKKKTKHKRKQNILNILHFEKIKHKYNKDVLYTKTINIYKRPVTVFVYYKDLDIPICSLNLEFCVSHKLLYYYIDLMLSRASVLLSNINTYTMYAAKHPYTSPLEHIKINKHSDKNILDIILKHQTHTSYTVPNAEQLLPFLLKIIIKPTQQREQLYINYNHNILLCPFQECIICFEEKYVKNICNNKHYCCFNCEKILKQYNITLCPMCRGNLK